MARSRGFLHAIAKAQREMERGRLRQQRLETQTAREAERARQAYLRMEKQAEKEAAKLYTESRLAEVNFKNEELEQQIDQLEGLLTATLSVDDFLDLDTLKQKASRPQFTPGNLANPIQKPELQEHLPPTLTWMQKLLPGAKKRYDQEVAKARAYYKKLLEAYIQKETWRRETLAKVKAKHEREVRELLEQIQAQNIEIEQFKRDFADAKPEAIVNYFTLVLEASSYPEDFPQQAKLAYVPESKQLVIEYDLPPFEVVPEDASYKYVKVKDEITSTKRPATQRKALYSSITAQITVRTIHELFEADRTQYFDTIVFNGYVDSIDSGTGREVRTCLVTVRTTRDVFGQLNLSKVDPIACLKTLNAGFSKSPAELAPVRPVLEFNMVDPRFVQETDVLSTLDQRPNLMELSPTEFESLITNLFQAMGLEAKQTQASRDGGVDCVAYDPRPVFGGKVVIQAKRYKNPVGVAAVRDLYGTVVNEGASKGILITTSGYGKDAFKFADGKPLELLGGSNLLHLLAEHAGMEAKIVPPEDWKDPKLDTASG